MRIIGIDFGEKRIGLAISDPLGITARGLDTLDSWYKLEQAVEQIVKIIEDNKASKVVVGIPKNMDGSEGFRVERTREFIALLKDETNAQIIEWDERLTTVMAIKTMNETGIKKSKKKKLVDKIAAVYILKSYLDSIN